jgi:hypothetical protein
MQSPEMSSPLVTVGCGLAATAIGRLRWRTLSLDVLLLMTLLFAIGQLPVARITQLLAGQASSESESSEEEGKTKTAGEELAIPRGRRGAVPRTLHARQRGCLNITPGTAILHPTSFFKALASLSPQSDSARRNGFGAPLLPS